MMELADYFQIAMDVVVEAGNFLCSKEKLERADAGRQWIVDAVDGTSNYSVLPAIRFYLVKYFLI